MVKVCLIIKLGSLLQIGMFIIINKSMVRTGQGGLYWVLITLNITGYAISLHDILGNEQYLHV